MLVVGLTGLIGSGKTTVANLFAFLGATIIDTDIIAHELTAPNGDAIDLIIEKFGYGMITKDGALNRSKMREAIFTNPDLRVNLEQILHPLILNQVKLSLELVKLENYAILVVPLLFRSKPFLELVSRTIFVDCQYSIILERLKERNGLNPQQVDMILDTQVDREYQLELADDIIENNGDIDALKTKVNCLHQKYLLLG